MKTLKTILLFLFLLPALLSAQPINAIEYNAIPNDNIDDSEALKTALYWAQVYGKDLLIPSGTYICNKVSKSLGTGWSSNRIMYVDNIGTKRIRIYGEAGTHITSSISTGSLLYFYARANDCVVENILFENTRVGASSTIGTCITLMGTGSNLIKNLTVRNCQFIGWGNSFVAQGLNRFTLENCTFEAPQGHDNAENSNVPAVFIKFYDNANGSCKDVRIINCSANGFTGNDISSLVGQRPMDGFIVGPVYGLQYTGNTTRNFCEEHIINNYNIPYTANDEPLLISGNHFYGALPAGTKDFRDLSKLRKAVTIIRCDAFNAKITNNQFYDVTSAILIRTYDTPTIKGRNYEISNNHFRSFRGSDGRYFFKYAINVTGYIGSGFQIEKCVVSNNIFDIDNVALGIQTTEAGHAAAIKIHYCENTIVDNNKIFISNVQLNGFNFYGITYDNISKPAGGIGIVDINNTIVGAPSGAYGPETLNIEWK